MEVFPCSLPASLCHSAQVGLISCRMIISHRQQLRCRIHQSVLGLHKGEEIQLNLYISPSPVQYVPASPQTWKNMTHAVCMYLLIPFPLFYTRRIADELRWVQIYMQYSILVQYGCSGDVQRCLIKYHIMMWLIECMRTLWVFPLPFCFGISHSSRCEDKKTNIYLHEQIIHLQIYHCIGFISHSWQSLSQVILVECIIKHLGFNPEGWMGETIFVWYTETQDHYLHCSHILSFLFPHAGGG